MSKIIHCKNCKHYNPPKPYKYAKRDDKGAFIGYQILYSDGYCELFDRWSWDEDEYCSKATQKIEHREG